MYPCDLRYWREMQGVTQKKLGTLIGRAGQIISNWECGASPIPAWLPDWLEFMEFELGRGRMPPVAPHAVYGINDILYPGRAERLRKASGKRPRRPNGTPAMERAAKRWARKKKQAAIEAEREMRRLNREAKRDLLARAAASRAERRGITKT